MTGAHLRGFGLAASDDAPIPYLRRIREYYAALGYGAPYEWAHYADVPFQRLTKPLSGSRVAIVTTAAPYQPDKGDQGPGAPYNAAAKFYIVYSGDAAILVPNCPVCHQRRADRRIPIRWEIREMNQP